MKIFGRKTKPAVVAVTADRTPVYVVVPMELMDKVFSRAAGRFCEGCNAFGSHHTDKHNEFARAALASLNVVTV